MFDVIDARAELARLAPVLDEFVRTRADVAELAASLEPGGLPTQLGGLPELKAAQARLDELMTRIQQSGAELKGLAPLLLDFPRRWTGYRSCCAGWKAMLSWPGTTGSTWASPVAVACRRPRRPHPARI